MTKVTVGGEVRNLNIDLLDLDPVNPRFLESQAKSSQQEIALYIDAHFDPLRVAESIDRHGFFVSEPLIATPKNERYVVVEGNRRLVALLGLADRQLRSMLVEQTKGWANLKVIRAPVVVPVVVVASREEVDALLGFRHISGIEPWEPFAQAHFVAELLEREQDFGKVAKRVGRTESAVRAMYRDHEILEQAATEFELDVSRARQSFGVFNAAMGVVNIRGFIGASPPREATVEYWPIPDDKRAETGRLLIYLFGRDDHGAGKVIKESRELQRLGRALASPRAEEALQGGASLNDALRVSVPVEERLAIEIETATDALNRATVLVPTKGLDTRAEIDAALGEAEIALGVLRDAVRRSR